MTSRWEHMDSDYPALRGVLGPEQEALDDAAIEEIVAEQFPGADAGYVEDFMRSMQQFGRQAAPILQTAGSGAAQGAMGGAALGPYGALFGALAGGASSLINRGGGARPTAAAPPPPAAPAPVDPGTAPPPSLAPAPQAVAPQGAASAQLLALLTRPETMQALMSLALAQAGRPGVPVGRHQVPASAFANAIAELAAEAADAGTESEDYWYDRRGMPRCDLPNPADRTRLLLADLDAAAGEAEIDEEETWDDTWDDEADDTNPLDSFEAALRGEYRDDD